MAEVNLRDHTVQFNLSTTERTKSIGRAVLPEVTQPPPSRAGNSSKVLVSSLGFLTEKSRKTKGGATSKIKLFKQIHQSKLSE